MPEYPPLDGCDPTKEPEADERRSPPPDQPGEPETKNPHQFPSKETIRARMKDIDVEKPSRGYPTIKDTEINLPEAGIHREADKLRPSSLLERSKGVRRHSTTIEDTDIEWQEFGTHLNPPRPPEGSIEIRRGEPLTSIGIAERTG
jgi:hypothetical protein